MTRGRQRQRLCIFGTGSRDEAQTAAAAVCGDVFLVRRISGQTERQKGEGGSVILGGMERGWEGRREKGEDLPPSLSPSLCLSISLSLSLSNRLSLSPLSLSVSRLCFLFVNSPRTLLFFVVLYITLTIILNAFCESKIRCVCAYMK